jgi:hypothetical protein
MAITAKDVEQLHEYAEGVMGRAGHHAGNVRGAALTILGGIIWRADPDSIRIRQYAGSPANMLWIKVAGRDYAFRYDHTSERIEIRDGSQKGSVLHTLDDTMSVADIQGIIQAL